MTKKKEDPTDVLTPTFGAELLSSSVVLAAYLALVYAAVHYNWIFANKLTAGIAGFGIFSFVCFGLTLIAVISVIAWPFKMLLGKIPFLGKHIYKYKEPEPEGLLSCPLCTGMWVGTILAVLGIAMFPVTDMIDLILHGLLGAGTSWLLYHITAKLGAYG